MNGTIKLVLIPENEIDTLALSMLSKSEVEAQYIDKVVQILDKQVDKHLVIKPKSRTDEGN
jgi:hypothetical protein